MTAYAFGRDAGALSTQALEDDTRAHRSSFAAPPSSAALEQEIGARDEALWGDAGARAGIACRSLTVRSPR
ncbi:hypothetical protein MARPU_13160 [Marichromatium purpuratum 984]|uniref:Uncharacterized protein n=1 Tax=Marichromatium purpuratum 984 TaxID=765910 RepID=W0E963_MARPU|nr:hypothetical protein MARPU_13160 [Marichromatium purpuratum 984]